MLQTVDTLVVERVGKRLVASIEAGDGTGWCGEALKEMTSALDVNLIGEAVGRELDLLGKKGNDGLMFNELQNSLKGLCRKLPENQGDKVASRLMALMEREAEPSRLEQLTSILICVAPRVSPGASGNLVGRLEHSLEKESDDNKRPLWANGIEALVIDRLETFFLYLNLRRAAFRSNFQWILVRA
jgi:hypothetical protein